MTLLLSGGNDCIRSACTVASRRFYGAIAAFVDVVGGGGVGCFFGLMVVLLVFFLVVLVVLHLLLVVLILVVGGVVHVLCGGGGGDNLVPDIIGSDDDVVVCVRQLWHSAWPNGQRSAHYVSCMAVTCLRLLQHLFSSMTAWLLYFSHHTAGCVTACVHHTVRLCHTYPVAVEHNSDNCMYPTPRAGQRFSE